MYSFLIISVIFIALSLMILLHELGHFLMARFFNLRVDEFGFGLPPRMFGKKISGTLYSLNWLPFGGFVKIHGEDSAETLLLQSPLTSEEHEADGGFRAAKGSRRALIIVAGAVMNFLLGWFLLSLVFAVGASNKIIIGSVADFSPAYEAGIKPNDILLEIRSSEEKLVLGDNVKIENVIDFTNRHKGKPLTIKIKRGSAVIEYAATPRLSPPEGEGALGIGMTQIGNPPQGLLAAVVSGFRDSVRIFVYILWGVVSLIAGIFRGEGAGGVVGPVGIVGIAVNTGELGFVYLIQLLALISLNLSVLNIIPFPALDGGRLLFIAIEKIKGSPISKKTESVVNGVGFFLLILLMIVITIRDLGGLL